MLSDTEYSDFDESDEEDKWAEYQQAYQDYILSSKEPAQTDIHIVTDEEKSDIENEEIKALLLQSPADVLQFGSDVEDDLSDLPPFAPGELELMWKYASLCGTAQTSSVKPKIMQIWDAPTESVQPDSTDLSHFTPDEVASLCAAIMQMQQEVYAAYQSRHEQQLQQEQLRFSEAESTCPAFVQSSPTPPLLTTGPSPLDFDQAHVPAVVSALPHTSPRVSCVYGQSLVSTSSPHTPHSSSRHSFSEEVCAESRSLCCAAVVNNIYVPPPRALSSTVSRQVSTVIQRLVIVPRVVLDSPVPSFQPQATQLDSTSSLHSDPAVSFGVIVDSPPSTDSALSATVSALSIRQFVSYTHLEPDEPKPPDINHSEFDDGTSVMSVDTPIASGDPEVLGPEQEFFNEDGDLDMPRHLLSFFDRVVDQGDLYDDEQDHLAAILRTYALMS